VRSLDDSQGLFIFWGRGSTLAQHRSSVVESSSFPFTHKIPSPLWGEGKGEGIHMHSHEDERIHHLNVTKISYGKKEEIEDTVVTEAPLTIFLNEEKVVTLFCTPQDQKYFAVGFLFSEGLLENEKDIQKVDFDQEKNEINIFTKSKRALPSDFSQTKILTSGCAKGVTYSNVDDIDSGKDLLIDLQLTLTASEIQALMHEFEKRSVLFRKTGGVHAAALANKEKILIYFEDIGRHNAVDKVFGKCLLNRIGCDDKTLLLSGRISSDILAKASKSGVSIIVSRSAPTNLAVENALKLGITAVGFARGSKMNIYSFPLRITI
jgi:FdhD protein